MTNDHRGGRGTTTSPMGIRYPIPIPTEIRWGGLEGRSPSISAQPSRDGEEQPETVACLALPAFCLGSYGSYASARTGRSPNTWSRVDFGMGSRGEFRTRRVRNTASLPWSPEPRTLNPRAWKGVWGRAPRRAARPTVGPSGARNDVRGGPRTEWRKGVEGQRPRGLRFRLYRTYIINTFIVHPCGDPI